jgi:hypothetical protein
MSECECPDSVSVDEELKHNCPSSDLAVWRRYQVKVREINLQIMGELFLRLCDAVHARELPWQARAQGDTIGFRSAREATFKVALHSNPRDKLVYEPPSILIHPPRPLSDLGVSDPYPHLRSFWVAQFSAQGWSVPNPRDVPDMAGVVDLVVALAPH